MLATAHTWRIEYKRVELVLFTGIPEIRIRSLALLSGGKWLYSLNHLTSSQYYSLLTSLNTSFRLVYFLLAVTFNFLYSLH